MMLRGVNVTRCRIVTLVKKRAKTDTGRLTSLSYVLPTQQPTTMNFSPTLIIGWAFRSVHKNHGGFESHTLGSCRLLYVCNVKACP